jgi:hypothetical protein
MSGGSAVIQSYPTLHIGHSDEGEITVNIDAPPMNLIGPELVRDLVGLVSAFESDPDVRVMVLGSADPEFFVPHVDLTKVAEYTAEAAKAGGPDDASLGMLWRKLSELPVVTIAKLRGRARGAGSELALACDMRFAARENTLIGQPELGFGAPLAPAVCNTSHGCWVGDEQWRYCWERPTSTRMRPVQHSSPRTRSERACRRCLGRGYRHAVSSSSTLEIASADCELVPQ